tara:strand:- start:11079 stop:11762 length:684 start_codon:yes stop_codon:yes gene_type:complete
MTTELTDQANSSPTGLHEVVVDGESHQISLDELKNGYQRQADYTRKTQELSRERERLAQGEAIVQALESDPEGAISALGDAFGVSRGNQNTDTSYDDVEDLDPEEARLRKLEANLEEHNRAMRQDHLQKEVGELRTKYSDDFNEHELFNHALKHNISNLEAAYTHMNYANKTSADASANANAEIVAEKRDAQIIDSSNGTPSGNIEPRATEAINSIRDAYELAKQQQ